MILAQNGRLVVLKFSLHVALAQEYRTPTIALAASKAIAFALHLKKRKSPEGFSIWTPPKRK